MQDLGTVVALNDKFVLGSESFAFSVEVSTGRFLGAVSPQVGL